MAEEVVAISLVKVVDGALEKKWKKKVGGSCMKTTLFHQNLITHGDTRKGGFDKLSNPIPQIKVEEVCTRPRGRAWDKNIFYSLVLCMPI